MSQRGQAYWRLLDTAEDYFRFGERTDRPHPGEVGLAEEVRAHESTRDAPRAAQATARAVAASTGTDWDGSDDELAVRRRRLAMLEERVRSCTRCALHEGRMNAVPGQGVLDPLVMVIGEGPGADEDRRGVPFVGRAGQYLDKWLEAIDLDRKTSVYIGNVVKCRPPGNRDPRPHETEACLPYLREQIALIRPRTILTVGRIATGILVGTSAGITRLRGRTFYYEGTPLVPTFHPSAVLRNQDLRRPVWDDLRRLRALIDRIGVEGADASVDGDAADGRADPDPGPGGGDRA